MTTIPKGALQRRQRESKHEGRRPPVMSQNKDRVRILKVYDKDRMEAEGVPSQGARTIARSPGRLYADIELMNSKRILFVPFALPLEAVMLLHGNSVQLEGKIATIVYSGYSNETGEIHVDGLPYTAATSDKTQGVVYDIGDIL